MYKAIFFDLDGTLTESGEGITKSVQYALEKIGKPEEDLEKLKVFVGPPLMEQFMKYAGVDEATGRKAVEFYRERYEVKGIYENHPYEGVEEMLQELKRKGYILAVASSKPEYYVTQILDYFKLSSYFDVVVGSRSTISTASGHTSTIRTNRIPTANRSCGCGRYLSRFTASSGTRSRSAASATPECSTAKWPRNSP